jgi:hypothetical protein
MGTLDTKRTVFHQCIKAGSEFNIKLGLTWFVRNQLLTVRVLPVDAELFWQFVQQQQLGKCSMNLPAIIETSMNDGSV